MLVLWLIRVGVLSLGLSAVLCTAPQQTSQLTSLHERMNQMLSALYSTPLLSKVKASSSEEAPAESPEPFNFPPAPQVVYVSPPSFEGPQKQYGYPLASPAPRPPYSFDYYQQQFPSLYSPPVPRLYPEYRYPQLPGPQPVSYPPFAPSSYSSFPPVQYPQHTSFGYQPGYPAPGLTSSFFSQTPYPPMPLPAPVSPPLYSPYSAPALPSPYPGPALPASYPGPALPASYPGPALPAPYSPLALPSSYSSALPPPYSPLPQLSSSPYSPPLAFPSPLGPYLPSLSYPAFNYPSVPKLSDNLPQPQYEYGS